MTRIIVALNPPDRNADFIYFARFVFDSLAKNPVFADPTPPLTVFEAHIAQLVDAQAQTFTRLQGAAAARNAMRAVVHGDLRHVQCFVQGLADVRTAEEAAAIVELSGMSVKRSSGHGKPDFDVKLRPVSGSVHLIRPGREDPRLLRLGVLDRRDHLDPRLVDRESRHAHREPRAAHALLLPVPSRHERRRGRLEPGRVPARLLTASPCRGDVEEGRDVAAPLREERAHCRAPRP